MVGMVYENVTQYGKTALRAMSRVSCRTVQRRRVLFRRGFLLILGALCLACGGLLLLIFDGLDASDRVIAVGSFLIGLAALAEGIFYRRLMAWNARRGLPGGDGNQERHFLFTDDFFQAGQPNIEIRYRYEALLAAYETAGYFVLFLDRRHCMAVDKAGFSRGTAEGLRTLLAEKMGKPVEFIG